MSTVSKVPPDPGLNLNPSVGLDLAGIIETFTLQRLTEELRKGILIISGAKHKPSLDINI